MLHLGLHFRIGETETENVFLWLDWVSTEFLYKSVFFLSVIRGRAELRFLHSWIPSQQRNLLQLWYVPINSPQGSRALLMLMELETMAKWTQVGPSEIWTGSCAALAALPCYMFKDLAELAANKDQMVTTILLISSCFKISVAHQKYKWCSKQQTSKMGFDFAELF